MSYTDEQIKETISQAKTFRYPVSGEMIEIAEQLLRERNEAKSTALKAVRERIAAIVQGGVERGSVIPNLVSRTQVLAVIDEEMNRARVGGVEVNLKCSWCGRFAKESDLHYVFDPERCDGYHEHRDKCPKVQKETRETEDYLRESIASEMNTAWSYR